MKIFGTHNYEVLKDPLKSEENYYIFKYSVLIDNGQYLQATRTLREGIKNNPKSITLFTIYVNEIKIPNRLIIFRPPYTLLFQPFPTEGVLEKGLCDDNLMLIGDTGGFVSPISGEGIQHALMSGKVAAETAIEALETEDYSKSILKKYKTHPRIKETVRSFKMKNSMRDFFYKNHGESLNKIFALTQKDPEFKSNVIDIFFTKTIPSKEFLSKFQ